MIKFHNTLSGKLEEFQPIDPKAVRMFVCGPTVYDYSHLGHAKTYTQFDIIARTLRYFGFNLTYVVNITDIDDKIINRSRERGIEPHELAREYEKAYQEDMKSLNITSVDKYARAHDYIDEIVSQVERMIEKGLAYKISDGWYFNTKKFEDYGKLSGRDTVKPSDAVSRVDENPEKINPGDFCLWKFNKQGDPFWPSSLGDGRPGWHIEDTAITETEFGAQYDIHGGAIDLIFPHHEAEIAQMESVSGLKPLVRYWLHTGFLNIKSEKMSKSLGNFFSIREALERGVSPLALRYYFLGTHYRSLMDFSWEGLEATENAYRRLKEYFTFSLSSLGGTVSEVYRSKFMSALDDDTNTPRALSVVWELVQDHSVSAADKRSTLLDFDKVLGLNLEHNEYEVIDVPEEVKELLEKRESARREKDWQWADKLRDEIREKGYEVLDTDQGPRLSRL